MSPRLRNLALTVHVVSSVAWIGAVAAFSALAIAGLTSQVPILVRAAYVAMEVITWTVIVPLSFVSPVSGIVQALGTSWGLIRHYWVLVKFLMTIPSTALLLLHMQPIAHVAHAAQQPTLAASDLRGLRIQLAVDACVAVAVLLVTTILAIYKPSGATPYGARKLRAEQIGLLSAADEHG